MYLLLAFLNVFVSAACATPAEIPTKPIDDTLRVERTLRTAVATARTEIQGEGTHVQLQYSSSAPIEVFITPLGADGSFDPRDILMGTLPPGEKQSALLQLNSSPLWSPEERTYRLAFVSAQDEKMQCTIVQFRGGSVFGTALGQYFRKETYNPTVYHRLRGPMVLGKSATLITGAALAIAVLLFVMVRRKRLVLPLLVLVLLFMQARFSLDAFRYSADHLSAWFDNGTYGSAGSAYSIAASVQTLTDPRIALCATGTSYRPTLLTYALYPVEFVQHDPTHVLVSQALDWSFEDGMLLCDGKQFRAEEISTFPDGSILFAVQ